MGADGEIINMGTVGNPKKGGIHNALNPVAGVPSQRPLIILKTRKEQWELMQSWPEAQQKHFRSLKTADEAEAYLASQGYGMA